MVNIKVYISRLLITIVKFMHGFLLLFQVILPPYPPLVLNRLFQANSYARCHFMADHFPNINYVVDKTVFVLYYAIKLPQIKAWIEITCLHKIYHNIQWSEWGEKLKLTIMNPLSYCSIHPLQT